MATTADGMPLAAVATAAPVIDAFPIFQAADGIRPVDPPSRPEDWSLLLEQVVRRRYWTIIGGSFDGSGNQFFTEASKGLGETASLFMIYDAERREQNTSFGEVLKWISGLRLQAEADLEEEIDKVRLVLEEAAEVARRAGWPDRIAMGLEQIAQTDYRTRASVFATFFVQMKPWMNQNITVFPAVVTSKTPRRMARSRASSSA